MDAENDMPETRVGCASELIDAKVLLALDNQLCFPLYACSKEVVRRYTPFLSELDLTYTQYIAMMVLWEEGEVSVTRLGERLYLDSGTLTPMLKKMEEKGLVRRTRSKADGRVLMVVPTEEGEALKERAVQVPLKMGACLSIDAADAFELSRLLRKLLNSLSSGGTDERE